VIEEHAERVPHFDAVLVDEFQDMSPLQVHLMEKLVKPSGSLTVVGDPNQSIYSFSGADPRVFNKMRNELPNVKVLRLVHNYRSSKQIIETTAAVIGNGVSRDQSVELRGQFGGQKPMIYKHINNTAEAMWIADRVCNLLKNGALPSEVAVLHRTSSGLYPIVRELLRKNIAISQYGQGAFLSYQATLVFVVYLRFLANQESDHLQYLLRNPHRKFLTERQLGEFRDRAAAVGVSLWEELQRWCAMFPDKLIPQGRSPSRSSFQVAKLYKEAAIAGISLCEVVGSSLTERELKLYNFMQTVSHGISLANLFPSHPGPILHAFSQFIKLFSFSDTSVKDRFLECLYEVVHDHTGITRQEFYWYFSRTRVGPWPLGPRHTSSSDGPTLLHRIIKHLALQDNVAMLDVRVMAIGDIWVNTNVSK
jgi:superfamily I DNA/RNA helicase